MADKQDSASIFSKEIVFPALFGDWMTYQPSRESSKQGKEAAFSPNRIMKEALEEALNVHYFFALEFSRYLKEALKASTDILSVSIEQVPYSDFLKRWSGGLIYNKLPVPNVGDILFIIDYQLANQIINFSLGFPSADEKMKELTDLEESMIHSIFGKALAKFPACWGNVFAAPELEILSYPNIQRETHINLNETITVLSAQFSIANSTPAMFTFAYQNNALKKLYELSQKKKAKMPLNFSRLSDNVLSSIQVPVFARLGTTYVAAKELMEIDTEDAISLDQSLNSPIALVIGQITELKAHPGRRNDHFAARIIGGGARKTKNEVKVIGENDQAAPAGTEGITPAESSKEEEFELPMEPQEKEEDMELPMELDEKEAYNKNSEELFGEDTEKTET